MYLYQWNKTAPIATGVTSASGYINTKDTAYWVDYVDGTGAHSRQDRANTSSNYTSVAAGSTAAGGGYFLQPDGTLRYGNTVIATGVASAVGYANAASPGGTGAAYYADIVYANGSAAFVSHTGGIAPLPAIPSGGTPVDGGYFPVGEDLYSWQDDGRLISHRVTSASGYAAAAGGTWWNDYVVRPSKCLV